MIIDKKMLHKLIREQLGSVKGVEKALLRILPNQPMSLTYKGLLIQDFTTNADNLHIEGFTLYIPSEYFPVLNIIYEDLKFQKELKYSL